jgi:alkylation response protein AidB-like acyl-CoA dehydrogenase
VRGPRNCNPDEVTVCFAAVEFELSSDQRDLGDAAAELLSRLASREHIRAFVGPGEPGAVPGAAGTDLDGFDRPLWEAMAEQGWLAVERDEPDGLGLGMVEVAVLCEQVGRRIAPAPFAGTILCMGVLVGAVGDASLPADTRRTAAEWVERLSTGEAIGCVVWSAEPGTTTAGGTLDRCRLDGHPEPTPYASAADLAVVVTEDAVYLVSLEDGGAPPSQPAMDRTRPLAWLRLDATPAHWIGGPEAAIRLVDRAATVVAAELLGASAVVLEMSVEYAKVRRQFGHPIGSFQAIKHRLADALVDVEAMRSCTYYAAWCLASNDPEASLAASMAKAWCSDASRRVMATGMQVHGGIGFTWDHDIHLYLKRAQLDASSVGTASWHRERIAGMLQRRLADGGSPF